MLAERIAKLITPAIEAMGFDLVRVQVSGSQRPTLQIMAEPASGRTMSVDANAVELTVDGADIRVPFPAVHKAKLVLTDALIALHQATEDNNEQEEA